MIPFQASIISQDEIAENTYAITFDIGKNPFMFIAGQYATITLPNSNASNSRDWYHDFSIASSPTELPLLTIAFRSSNSIFKKTFLALRPGDYVSLEGPKGVFFLPDETSKSIVFIAGGIGITPFRSMIRYMIANNMAWRPSLFYFNRNPESSVFLQELRSYEHVIRLHAIFGQITKQSIMIDSEIKSNSLYYIAGPPGMVKIAKDNLSVIAIADENIRTEEFTGYE